MKRVVHIGTYIISTPTPITNHNQLQKVWEEEEEWEVRTEEEETLPKKKEDEAVGGGGRGEGSKTQNPISNY